MATKKAAPKKRGPRDANKIALLADEALGRMYYPMPLKIYNLNLTVKCAR